MDLLEHRDKKSTTRHPWETARFELMLKLLYKDHILSSSNNIADIGCGDTYIVNSLSNLFPEKKYIAIDSAFSLEDIEYFNSKTKSHNISLLRNIENIKPEQNIDLILLMDVIEHIEFEEDFLRLLLTNDFINNNTKFLITVPAFNSLFSDHDKHLKHYRRYSLKELKKVVKSAGLEIQYSGYFFSSLLFIRVVQKINESFYGSKEQKGLNNKEYNKKTALIAKTFLLLDFGITNLLNKIGLKIPGLSTYVICTKSAQ